ncbi:MAG: C40 family peptidase [Lactobacillales bacterium]|nr:C40 family peptidase [Lactobacillales bacterium]
MLKKLLVTLLVATAAVLSVVPAGASELTNQLIEKQTLKTNLEASRESLAAALDSNQSAIVAVGDAVAQKAAVPSSPLLAQATTNNFDVDAHLTAVTLTKSVVTPVVAADEDKALLDLVDEKISLVSDLNATDVDLDAVSAEIETLSTEVDAQLATRAGKADQIISIAKTKLGAPYVYGSSGPRAFDCSGFTQYVFGQFGISLGRATYNQESAGTRIALSAAQPGDLVFWGRAGATYHVGIYLGGGNYIHAAAPGKGVRIQSIASYAPSFAVRVLG